MDYRKGKKVVLTIELEDKGQDFIELDVLEDGVLLGDSVIFRDGRLSLIGIGALTGTNYHSRDEILQLKDSPHFKVASSFVYFKETGEKDPLPWKAQTLKYAVTGIKEAKDQGRFIKK
jgi:hypothetical protein